MNAKIDDMLRRAEIVKPRKQPTSIDTAPEVLTLADMLARFVHVAKGPLIVDSTNTHRRLRPSEFKAAYAHCRVQIDERSVPITSLWAQSERRQTADTLTFNPAEGQFFMERDLRQLNTWAPPKWPETDSTLAASFFDHLTYLIPDARGREDLADWLAHAVQQPAIRPHFHFLLVAQSSEGTGRSWLGDLMRRLFSERHAGAIDLHKLLEDQFNSELSGKIVMAVHEVRAPADERHSHRDRLKSLLTDTSLVVNEKHEPRWTERFVTRFLMFTNRDDALPLSETDRRVYAVRCAEQPRDEAYYKRLYAHLEDVVFLAAVWTSLRNRNIAAFNPGRRAPLNEMKKQIIAAGRTEEQQIAVEFVKACPHSIVATEDLMKALVPAIAHEQYRDRKARTAAIVAVLKEIGLQTLPKKIRIGDTSTRVWVLHDPALWVNSTAARQKIVVQQAAEEFKTDYWSAAALIQHWESPDAE